MIPETLHPLFWDINVQDFDPVAYPDYAIFRVLEYGDTDAVAWMRSMFEQSEIRRVIATERRLSRKSASYWALIYGIPKEQVAGLRSSHPFLVAPQ